MPAFPGVAFPNTNVKVRFEEASVPAALNTRWLGMPRGVYIGFIPQTAPGNMTLTLAIDPNHNFSLLKVGAQTEKVMVDIFTADPVLLNFTGHTQWPVYVVSRCDYVHGAPTQARIFARALPAAGPQEVLICKVDKPGANLVVTAASPGTKQPPVAFQGQAFGFMPGGSVEQIASTVPTVAEVIAARLSPYTGAHTSLSARIADDLGGTEIANRLGLRQVNLLSNVHTSVSGGSTNVSGSFAATSRSFAPNMLIEANATEVLEGVITGPLDPVRNVCFVVNAKTRQRIVDAGQQPVYGRLTFTSGTVGAGKTIRFYNASDNVDGNGTNPFGGGFQAGDIVLAPDLKYYEVKSITDANNAVLRTAYEGGVPMVPDTVVNTTFRRFTLSFLTVVGGPFVMPTTDIQFISPAFFRTDRAIFDGFLYIKMDGEKTEPGFAAPGVAGRFKLAVVGGLVGSVRTIKNSGAVIGNNFHTLNFAFGGATNAGGGVANVSVPGATGPAGAPGSAGPKGSTGPNGAGYTDKNTFADAPTSSGTTGVALGPVSISFTKPFGWPVVHASGGWSYIDGPNSLGFERLSIDSLTVAGNTATITASINPAPNFSPTEIRVFLGAST